MLFITLDFVKSWGLVSVPGFFETQCSSCKFSKRPGENSWKRKGSKKTEKFSAEPGKNQAVLRTDFKTSQELSTVADAVSVNGCQEYLTICHSLDLSLQT